MSKYVVVDYPWGLKKYPTIKTYAYNEGYKWEYKNHDKKKDYVYIPREYKFMPLGDDILCFKEPGNDSAAYWHIGPSIDKDMPGDDLSELVRNDVMGKGYKTIAKTNWTVLIVLLIVVAVIVAGVIGFKVMGPQSEGAQQQITTEVK